MVVAEPLPYRRTSTYVKLSMPISIKAANCKNPADAETKKLCGPHASHLAIVLRILQLRGDVDNSHTVPDREFRWFPPSSRHQSHIERNSLHPRRTPLLLARALPLRRVNIDRDLLQSRPGWLKQVEAPFLFRERQKILLFFHLKLHCKSPLHKATKSMSS